MATPYREFVLSLFGTGMVVVRLIAGARGGVTVGICFRDTLGSVDGVISDGAVITLGSTAAGDGLCWTG